ncbi:MAG TPA: hypothetical protein VIS72_10885 [Anaerolineales bacterium]
MKFQVKNYLLPRLQDVFFLVIFIMALVFGDRMLNLDGDLPRHLAAGKLILQARAIPASEPFVYPLAEEPYTSHEWLTDVVLYLIHSVSGAAGLVWFTAVLLSSTFLILYSHLSARFNLRLPSFFILALGAAVTSLNWSLRPHMLSMFFLSIWLVWTDKLSRGEKVPVWIFPAFMVLWANLHGEFIAGILVLFAFSAGWLWDFIFDRENVSAVAGRSLWLALLLSLFATLLNPSGLQPWRMIIGVVNNDYLMSRIAENHPPDFSQSNFLILMVLLVLSVALLAIKKERIATGKAFLLAGFTAMSLMAGRNIHLYGIVAPFILVETLLAAKDVKLVNRLETVVRGMEKGIRGALWILIVTAFIGVNLLSGRYGNIYQFDNQVFPVDAVNWLESHPQNGQMFNKLDWGGYIEFRLGPENKVFADSISDVTGEVTRKYETVIGLADGWESILNEHHVDWTIIPTKSELAATLKEAGWDILYEDETATILRR